MSDFPSSVIQDKFGKGEKVLIGKDHQQAQMKANNPQLMGSTIKQEEPTSVVKTQKPKQSAKQLAQSENTINPSITESTIKQEEPTSVVETSKSDSREEQFAGPTVSIDVTFYVLEIEIHHKIKSTYTLLDLKNYIYSDFTIPINNQCLSFYRHGVKQVLQIDQNLKLETLCETGRHSLQVQISRTQTMEFYGFNANYLLTYDQLSSFQFDTESSIYKFFQNFHFEQTQKESEFFSIFSSFLFSSLKKGSSISSSLNIVRQLVKIKFDFNLWAQIKGENTLTMEQSFVLMYLLSNSDLRLRVKLMNLIKSQMPIPLSTTSFTSIFDPNPTFCLNNEIGWVLQKGITVCSIGFHSQLITKQKIQTGKSYLLNQIFQTNLCLTKNKHRIMQKVPEICIKGFRVNNDLFPLNIIDIPRNCDQQLVNKIIRSCDVVIIQSWRKQSETAALVQKLKQHSPKIITILRDYKEQITINSQNNNNSYLLDNKIIKLVNLSHSSTKQTIINNLRNQFNLFFENFSQKQKQSHKIFNLCQNQQLNDFRYLIYQFQGKNIDFCSLSKYQNQQQVQFQSKQLHSNFENILKFFTRSKIPYQILLTYFNQSIRSLQNQRVNKYKKLDDIYHQLNWPKCDFKQCLQKLKEIVKYLSSIDLQYNYNQLLNELNCQTIDYQQIQKKLSSIMVHFQSKIKQYIFSVEMFWREIYAFAYLHPNYKINEKDLMGLIIDIKSKEIMSSEPFQLVDRNCLQIPKAIFNKIFSSLNDKCLVISVIGFEKTTLLNQLFGCGLTIKQGEYIHGLYGTYLRIKKKQLFNYDSIFVIDPERLQVKKKQNSNKNKFDELYLLYCLTISDVVLIDKINQLNQTIVHHCYKMLQYFDITGNQIPLILTNKQHSIKIQQHQSQKLNKKFFMEINTASQQISMNIFQSKTTKLLINIMGKISKSKGNNIYNKIRLFYQRWETIVPFLNIHKQILQEHFSPSKRQNYYQTLTFYKKNQQKFLEIKKNIKKSSGERVKYEETVIDDQKRGVRMYSPVEKEHIFKSSSLGELEFLKNNIQINNMKGRKQWDIINIYKHLIQFSKYNLSTFIQNDKMPNLIFTAMQKQPCYSTTTIKEMLTNAIFSQNFIIYSGQPLGNPNKTKYIHRGDYFKKQTITNEYSLSSTVIYSSFNLKAFIEVNQTIFKEYYQNLLHSKQVLIVFNQINEYLLEKFGFSIKEIDTFQQLYLQQTQFFIMQSMKIYQTKQIQINILDNFQLKETISQSYHKAHQFINISLSDVAFIQQNQQSQDQIIWELKPTSVIKSLLVRKIQWRKIQEFCYKQSGFEKSLHLKEFSSKLLKVLNTELQSINLQIQESAEVLQIFNKQLICYQRSQSSFLLKVFKFVKTQTMELEWKKVEIYQRLEKLIYFDGWKLQEGLKINDLTNERIIIGKTIQIKEQLIRYSQAQTNIHQKFQWSKQQIFIIEQLKRKGSFEALLERIIDIVENKRNYIEGSSRICGFQMRTKNVFILVSKEIIQFEEQLKQIYYRFSYVGISKIYQIICCKMCYDEVSIINWQYKALIKKEQQKIRIGLQKFMKDTYYNLTEIITVQVEEFFKQILTEIGIILKEEKETITNKIRMQFKMQITRKRVNKIVDGIVFNSNNETIILDYLNHPLQFIQKKYEEYYELYYAKMQNQYYAKIDEIIGEFTSTFSSVMQAMKLVGIEQQKGSPYYLFEKESRTYDIEEAKEILFNYFIYYIIGKTSTTQIMCKDVKFVASSLMLEIVKKLQISRSYSKKILLRIIEKKSHLKITNLFKFALVFIERASNIKSQFKRTFIFQHNQKIQLIDSMRVTICKEQCPSCGRLCEIEQYHSVHKVLYGHQVRAVMGNYFYRSIYDACTVTCQICQTSQVCGMTRDHEYHHFPCGHPKRRQKGVEIMIQRKEKVAYALRCSQLIDTDIIQYSGTSYTWLSFKTYWRQSAQVRWNFQYTVIERRFYYYWMKISWIICKTYNFKFIKTIIRLDSALNDVHFILVLDESGSMTEEWRNLIRAITILISLIADRSKRDANTYMSIICFSDNANIIYNRVKPNQINVQSLYHHSGGTNFGNALQKAYSIASSSYIKKEQMVTVFMTDGLSQYPTYEVEKMRNLKNNYQNNFQYFGVFFGVEYEGYQVMERIKNQLNRKSVVYRSTNAGELQQSYRSCLDRMMLILQQKNQKIAVTQSEIEAQRKQLIEMQSEFQLQMVHQSVTKVKVSY